MSKVKNIILWSLIVTGLIVFGLTLNIVWAILEITHGPIFPEWVYEILRWRF